MITQTPSHNMTYLVSLLPGWLLNGNHNASQSCAINRLSTVGATVLIPRNITTPAVSFNLAFISPDNTDEILATLPAEVSWIDESGFPCHIEYGVVFAEMNQVRTDVVNALIEILVLKKISAARWSADISLHDVY
jgi:hypothetical protein